MADPKIILTAEDRTKAAFESAKKGLTELQTKALAVTGVLGALGVSAFVADLASGVQQAINEWDELGKAAQRAGFQSAQGMAEFQYAAKLAGVDAVGFETAVGKLSDKMADAAGGGKQAAAVFAAMGVKIKDAGGQLRSTEAVVADLAKAFAGYKAGPEKTALALELFGKSGKALIPLLNGGADGLEKLRAEFRLLHGALDEGTTKAAEQFNDNLTKLSTAAGGLKREMAERLLPGLNQITEAMVEQAKKGNVLLAVWAGLKEFAAIGTNTDETGNKIRNAEWLNEQLRFKGAQLSLLAAAKEAGGDSDGQLQAKIDKLRRELESLQKHAFAASKAVKQVFNPAYTDAGGTTGDFARMDRAAGGPVGARAPTPPKGDGAAAKESAYAAVNKTVMERLALQKQELARGRELTEMEKLEAKALEDLNQSKVKVTDAQRKDIQAKLADAKINETIIARQRQDEKDRMAAGQAWMDEQKAIADFADKQRKREEDQLVTGRKTLEQVEFETRLLTMNNEQREVAIALRDLENQGIKQGTVAWDTYAAKIKEAISNREIVRAGVDSAKRVQEEWDSTCKQISQSFVDNLMRGGKSVAQYLKDLFRTLVLRPILAPVGQAVSGIVGGVMGAPAAAQTGGGSAATSMLGSTVGSMFGAGGLGGSLMAGAGWMTGATTFGGSMAAAGSLMATGTAAGTMAGVGMALGAVAPIALAVLAIATFVKSRGETRSGGKYTDTTYIEGPSGGEINGQATRDAIAATQAGINQTLAALGSSATLAGLQSGFEQSKNGKGFAYAGGTLSTGAAFGQTHGAGWQNRRGSMTAEEAAAAFGEELKQATLQALQAADVPGQLGDYLRSLGDIDALSGGALDAALARIQKALSEKQTLEEQLYVLTHTELEVLNRNRQREREALDESNRALYDQIVSLQDQMAAADAVSAASEAAAAATQALADSLQATLDTAYQDLLDARRAESDALKDNVTRLESAAQRYRAFSTDIRNFRDSLLLGDLSPLTPGQRYAESRRIAEETYNRALTGDADAMSQIPQVARDFLEASKVYNASSDAYLRDFATVQTYLTLGAVKADEAASWAQAQAAIGNAQLAALGTINASVLTVAQAMANLRTAGAAAIGSGVGVGDDALSAYLTTAVARGDYMDGYTALQASGRTMAEGNRLAGLAAGTIEDWARYNGLQTFASGGSHSGGWAVVGERGPELAYMPPARIYSNSETRGMVGGNDALLRELQALRKELRDEIAALRVEHRQGVAARNEATIEGARLTVQGVTAGASRVEWERQRALEAIPR